MAWLLCFARRARQQAPQAMPRYGFAKRKHIQRWVSWVWEAGIDLPPYAPDQAKPMHIADAQASVFAVRKRTSITPILFSQAASNLITYRKQRAFQLHARSKTRTGKRVCSA